MDNQTKTGGPALPVNGGMTILDYFAGQAMVGLCARIERNTDSSVAVLEADAKSLALQSYLIAEAMLAEREKQ